MKIGMKFTLIALLFAIPALMSGAKTPIGMQFWPAYQNNPTPTDGQLPFYILLVFIEALALGIGMAYLILGWKRVKAVKRNRRRAKAVYFSIGWLLVNWYFHGNLHIHNGPDTEGLLYIEYGFHVTMIIAAFVLAYCYFSMLREQNMKAEGSVNGMEA